MATGTHDSLGTAWGKELPLVGRRADVAVLRMALDDALEGRGRTLLLTGEPGIGKSRLLALLAQEARNRQMQVAMGRGFSVESGVPYGAFADALAAPLHTLEPGTLTVLARGAEDDLRAIMPAFPGVRADSRARTGVEGDDKARLLWIVMQFLTRLATRQPLLLVLDNAQWADPSSLELLHFVARQIAQVPLLLVLAYADDALEPRAMLQEVSRSLLGARQATRRQIEPLTLHDLTELLQRSFAIEQSEAQAHATVLLQHTSGNPFFVEETLKSLVSAGRIRRRGDGWFIEDAHPDHLPATVRDAVRARLDALSPAARRLAEFASLVEGAASLALLQRSSALESEPLADAIDELMRKRIVLEDKSDGSGRYAFSHPILQALVRDALSAARERALHARIATALEELHGASGDAHASAIARHLVRGHELGGDARALHYLAAAGRDALQRRADVEAVRWLADACSVAERLGDRQELSLLLEELGCAEQRTGDTSRALQQWSRALTMAEAAEDADATARLLYRLGQEAARSGDAHEGLERLEQAEAAARTAERPDLVIKVRVAHAKTLQALGRHAMAIASAHETLALAQTHGHHALQARVHQLLLQLQSWTGPVQEARAHGERALALAESGDDPEVAWATHWAMAMLAGFTGDAAGAARHQQQATRLAESLSSPLLLAMTAEITIEHASGTGRWDEGIALAEQVIPVARVIAPQSLLPRLLVWTGLMTLARDETERSRALFEEAWRLSDAEHAVEGLGRSGLELANVHNAILAHTGMGHYWLARGAWQRALTYGERGLAIADRYGYIAWAIHRLIPLVLEAGLWLQQYDRVEELTARLRTQSAALDHRLGLAWAKSSEALVARLRDHHPDAARQMLEAADDLDAVPFVFHAARLRRNAAQLLEADGDATQRRRPTRPTAAVRELRRAHDVFARIGAERELRETRSQLRSLGVRLPPRTTTAGVGSLTGRELEIARAVANRLSNKQIGAALDISARTVSTHLSNIFQKLGLDSRGALADRVRDDPQFQVE
jgi:DNA-binding NarL/FixJ family response regulator